MALVIEDGTIVAGANTYVTAAEAKSYASDRGIVGYPTDDSAVSILLIIAKDYLEAQRLYFSGSKVESTQPLQYPRQNSTVDGLEFPDDEIPNELKYAQMQLSIDALEFGSLLTSSDGYAIAVEEVDVIKVEYAAGGRLSGTSLPAEKQFPQAQAWLDCLMANNTAYLKTVRI